MSRDTPQGKNVTHIAIRVSRDETLALLDLLAVACNYMSERREALLPLYKDMKQMAKRRGWCARAECDGGAPNSEASDGASTARPRTGPVD